MKINCILAQFAGLWVTIIGGFIDATNAITKKFTKVETENIHPKKT